MRFLYIFGANVKQHLGQLVKSFNAINILCGITFLGFAVHAFYAIKAEYEIAVESEVASVRLASNMLIEQKNAITQIVESASATPDDKDLLSKYINSEDVAFIIKQSGEQRNSQIIFTNTTQEAAIDAQRYLDDHIKDHTSSGTFIFSDLNKAQYIVARYDVSSAREQSIFYGFSEITLPDHTMLVSEMEAENDAASTPFSLNIHTKKSFYPAFISYEGQLVPQILIKVIPMFTYSFLMIIIWFAYAKYLRFNYPRYIINHLKNTILNSEESDVPKDLIGHRTSLGALKIMIRDVLNIEMQRAAEVTSALKDSCHTALIMDDLGIIRKTVSKHTGDLFAGQRYEGAHFHDALTDTGFIQSPVDKNEYIMDDGEHIYTANRNKDTANAIVIKSQKAQQQNMSSAMYDELTSVYNRYNFTDVVEKYLATSPEKAYLVLVDVNNFKLINDSAGFEVGDSVLMELSSIVREHTREKDVVGRLSGDEFVVLFKEKTLQQIEKSVTDIYNAISNYNLTHYDTKLNISVSIGIVSLCDTSKDLSVTMALQAADYAAMTAKKNGFTYQMYDANNDDIIFFQEAPIWIERIKSAIEHGNFEIFAQEIRTINPSNDRKHAEVLIRMKDEKGGYFSPFQFFGFAEKFNLMLDIDDWMISETFKLHRNTGQTTSLSINMTADSVKSSLFIAKIIQYARQYKIKPETIMLEVTETMAIDDMNGALKNINTLKAFGFKIALDDFGSGFSTLMYLQNIEADFLKIDGIFVKNIKNSPRDKAIVENVVHIAHDLNMQCIAEFVEDEETIAILKDCGVDYVQGFGIHKPEPCIDWIAKQNQKAY